MDKPVFLSSFLVIAGASGVSEVQGQTGETPMGNPYVTQDSTGKPGSFLENIAATSMIFGDIEGNNADDDLLIIGNAPGSASNTFIKLFKNNGSGQYSEHSSGVFTALSLANGAWSKSNDSRILTAGRDSNNNKTTKLYIKSNSGNYEEMANPVGGSSPFMGVEGFVGFADFNGDGKDDVLLWDDAGAFVYVKEPDGNYTQVTNSLGKLDNTWFYLDGVAVDFGDYNKDGKADILAITYDPNKVALYESVVNNGNLSFSEVALTIQGGGKGRPAKEIFIVLMMSSLLQPTIIAWCNTILTVPVPWLA